jgi:cystathionine gamma-synthase
MSSTYRAGGAALYGRDDNSTWEAFEAVLGALEGAAPNDARARRDAAGVNVASASRAGGPIAPPGALAFSSGMGAIAAVMETVPMRAPVVVAADSYNGTRKWCFDAEARGRLEVRLVDVTDTDAVIDACDGAALVWLESPTNPSLLIGDIAAIAEGAHAAGALVAVDNTLPTPVLQRPLALGADVVVHSVSKWLGGHADLIMGAVVTDQPELLERLRTRRSLGGAIPGSVETFLALRGIRSLTARLLRAQETAGELARRLDDHAGVDRVRYPGLPGDPGHALASRQMDGPGAMVSFEVAGGAAAAEAVCTAVEVLTPGTSLGGVETMIERRGRYAFEERTPPSLLRMSVGQEDVEDLWEDLDQAIARAV